MLTLLYVIYWLSQRRSRERALDVDWFLLQPLIMMLVSAADLLLTGVVFDLVYGR